MKKLILFAYNIYYATMSRAIPRLASFSALKLLFTVNMPKRKFLNSKEASEIISLQKSDAYLSYWKGKENKTALLVHGWNGNLSQFNAIFDALTQKGFSIYGVSPRGHEYSDHKMSHPGFFMKAVIEACELLDKEFDVAVGHSMGAGAIGCIANKHKVAKCLVLISCPASFRTVIDRFSNYLSIGGRARAMFLENVERFVGIDFNSLEVHQQLAKSNIPCLVVHDQGDRQVPFADAKLLVESKSNAMLLSKKNKGHSNILNDKETAVEVASWIDDNRFS